MSAKDRKVGITMGNTTVTINGQTLNIQEWVNEYCHPWTNSGAEAESWEECEEIHTP